MLASIGVPSLDALIDEAIPRRIRLRAPLDLPGPESEHSYLRRLAQLAARNQVFRSYIGLGYHDTITPSVILRMVMENPGWYTPYTPYQAEIAQGRLESLLNFQTMVTDLTGMEVANASLLDEATAAAEAMTLLHRVQTPPTGGRAAAPRSWSAIAASRRRSTSCASRAEPLGHRAPGGAARRADASTTQTFGAAGAVSGRARPRCWTCGRSSRGRTRPASRVAVGTDLLALALLTPPGEMGADVVFGNSQRFGVPLGYGGPHAAFFATRKAFVRQMPGRIIGVSVDAHGRTAYRMALATREQHIRREKATSNICTAQALLANMAAMYAVYHGPDGLRGDRRRVHDHARALQRRCAHAGLRQLNDAYFDTLRVEVPDGVRAVRQRAEAAGINFRYLDDRHVEHRAQRDGDRRGRGATSPRRSTGARPVRCRGGSPLARCHGDPGRAGAHDAVPDAPGVQHAPVRNADDALHPAPRAQGPRPRHVDDSARLVHDEAERGHRDAAGHVGALQPPASVRAGGPGRGLRSRSCASSERRSARSPASPAVSLQPNSGAQGEFAGLLVIRAYHRARGDDAARRRADSGVGARHQPGQRRDGRHARRGGGQRARRRTWTWRISRRKAAEHRRSPGVPDDHLPLDARRLRGAASRTSAPSSTSTAARCTWTART